MKRSFTVAIPAMIILLFSSLFFASCTYVTPEAENPNPGLEKDNVKYLVTDGVLALKKEVLGYETNQQTNQVKEPVGKLWLCGWAPVSSGGGVKGWGGLTNTPYNTRHCNMEMRISKDGRNLLAKNVDLNYPGDFEKWDLLFTIPILQHYFYEKEVDSRGRELNRYAKVSDRKNWKLAPIMDLDLRGIKFEDKTKSPEGFSTVASILQAAGGSLTDVYDIEISKENDQQFIGFTATRTHSFYGSLIQNEWRFNFLEIKENPGFKKTAYNTRSAKYMNILHVLGNQPNGDRADEVNWAAHWDVSEPVEFCINGFPEDWRGYQNIGQDVIDEMNAAMEKIGAVKKGQKAFVVSTKKPKYHFDLRCPSISWVDDPILSFRAPLGIGLVNTNVATGEILWGGAVIWGGLIDRIINRDSESAVDAMANATHKMLQDIDGLKNNPYFEDIGAQLQLNKWSRGALGYNNLQTLVEKTMGQREESTFDQVAQFREETLARLDKFEKEENPEQREAMLNNLIQDLQVVERIKDFSIDGQSIEPLSLSDSDLAFDARYNPTEQEFIDDLNRFTGFVKSVSYTGDEKTSLANAQGHMDIDQATRLAREFISTHAELPFDYDNRFENHYDAWASATSSMAGLEKAAAAYSTIKNVTLHELGHVVGLGHQFEGNRMPVRGTVPDKVYDALAAEVPNRHNYSSIMDYQSGHTEVSLPKEKVKMQVQDELTLAYLYNQQYATYRAGDEDWTFFTVREDGIIPVETPMNGNMYPARYMPQCSDLDALLASSPYCRRWDRGHDAPTMVEENLKEYTDSFISQLNSFTEATGSNPYFAKYRLWASTYRLMNYNRAFYDTMRYHLSNNDVYQSAFRKIRNSESALLSFSKACIDPTQATDDTWGVEFAKLAIQPLYTEAGANTLEELQRGQSQASYQALYSQYKSIVGNTNTRDLDADGFDRLEEKLNANGLAFSEMQKLCRASKRSLDVAKLLLSLKGPDHPKMNYDTAIVPTGLRGGEATSDWSRAFGTYEQLGLLPLKIAALDVLTATASTFQYGWWNIPKYKFNDPNDGKFGYFAMYPEEFTDVVGTAVKNNMGFGGTKLQDAATMSIANLYMNYFLRRTFVWSNDNQARGFNTDYLTELKAQTKFQVAVSPVLLQSIDIPGEPTNKRFGFRPTLYSMRTGKTTDLPEAYLLPEKKVIVRGNDSQIILPISKLRFMSQNTAYVWALEVTYDKTSYDDPLQGFTVKNSISELTTQELDKCIAGAAGLATFFNTNEEFTGFQIDPAIATDPDAQTNFEISLQEAFKAYQNREGQTPTQIGCEESLKGVGLVTSTALSLNGFILPQVFEYIKK